jgi:hypothetical protein
MMKSKLLLAVLVCLAVIVPAQAETGSFSLVFDGSPAIVPGLPGGTIGAATLFTLDAPGTVFGPKSGYFSTIPNFSSISFNGTLAFSTASAGSVVLLPEINWASWTFNATPVTFDLASYKITQTPPSGDSGGLSIYLYGTYNDTGIIGGTSTAAFNFSFSQVLLNEPSQTATFAIPAPPPTAEAPEPATMGLMGASLVGVALLRRRLAKR